MSNTELIERPSLDFEVKAEIKSLGMIEDNISEVKEKVIKLNEYYKNITFTEDTMKQATEEKANVNKFKKAVADYRKNIIAEYKKPIEIFENTAKETEKILANTYNTINEQVEKYKNIQKEQIEKEVKDYFEEYKTANNIDFITYKQARINVTLSASMKSLKEQVKTFIDKVVDDLNLIETQEHKAEILVEYKQSLNVSQAITAVTNRFKAIEEEKRKQEEKQSIEEFQKSVIVPKEEKEFTIEDKFEIMPEKKEITLKLKIYEEQIQQLKKFLNISNIEYESEGF